MMTEPVSGLKFGQKAKRGKKSESRYQESDLAPVDSIVSTTKLNDEIKQGE